MIAGKALKDDGLRGRAWSWLRARLRPAAPARAGDEAPLRAELLGAAQMEQHGKMLAKGHELRRTPAPDRLLKRLAENEAALVRTCNLLIAATVAGR
ncbi:MAG TPA: hypothetical protein VD867_12725, partial [Burkholderiales bacterium]|nr:hypothetical protein [Burkholderiales bacterium]